MLNPLAWHSLALQPNALRKMSNTTKRIQFKSFDRTMQIYISMYEMHKWWLCISDHSEKQSVYTPHLFHLSGKLNHISKQCVYEYGRSEQVTSSWFSPAKWSLRSTTSTNTQHECIPVTCSVRSPLTDARWTLRRLEDDVCWLILPDGAISYAFSQMLIILQAQRLQPSLHLRGNSRKRSSSYSDRIIPLMWCCGVR